MSLFCLREMTDFPIINDSIVSFTLACVTRYPRALFSFSTNIPMIPT